MSTVTHKNVCSKPIGSCLVSVCEYTERICSCRHVFILLGHRAVTNSLAPWYPFLEIISSTLSPFIIVLYFKGICLRHRPTYGAATCGLCICNNVGDVLVTLAFHILLDIVATQDTIDVEIILTTSQFVESYLGVVLWIANGF